MVVVRKRLREEKTFEIIWDLSLLNLSLLKKSKFGPFFQELTFLFKVTLSAIAFTLSDLFSRSRRTYHILVTLLTPFDALRSATSNKKQVSTLTVSLYDSWWRLSQAERMNSFISKISVKYHIKVGFEELLRTNSFLRVNHMHSKWRTWKLFSTGWSSWSSA